MKWKALITHPTVSGLTTSTPKAPAQGLSRHVQRLGVALTLLASALPAAAAESHLPYLDGPRAMIQRGVQAVLLCNGVFTSERPLEAVFREELAYLKAPLGSPATAFSTAGNRGQYVIILPEQDLVIVRRGLDWGKQGFDRWDLLREVPKAF